MKSQLRRKLHVVAATLTCGAALAFMSGCGKSGHTPPSYSHFESIGSDGWHEYDIMLFEPWPTDSAEAATSTYRMELVARYSARYPASRIPAILSIEDENGPIRKDTLLIGTESTESTKTGNPSKESSAKEGADDADAGLADWNGGAKYGVRQTSIILEPHLRLTEGYRVGISPLLPDNKETGLLNIGILLVRNETKTEE